MARRRKPEQLIAELRATEDAAAPVVETALRSKSGPVLAMVARRVSECGWTQHFEGLEAAFYELCDDGKKRDPGCSGKVAIVRTLSEVDRQAWSVYRQGASYEQREPVWGGSEDTAGELRARCLLALVHTRHPEAIELCAEALTDARAKVREAAATAIGDSGHLGAPAVLRLKLRLGDEDPEVLAAALSGLLSLDKTAGLDIGGRLLADRRDIVREAVGLCLGESRHEEALDPLIAWHRRAMLMAERRVALTAIALLRCKAALCYLEDRVASATPDDAAQAVAALGIFSHDPAQAERVRQAAAQNNADLTQALEEAGFGS